MFFTSSWRLRKTVVLVSEVSVERVETLLRQLMSDMQPGRNTLPDPLLATFQGDIQKDSFVLVWRQGFMHHLAPLVQGSYSPCSTGTLLMLTFTLQSYMAFFLTVGASITLFTAAFFIGGVYRPDLALYLIFSASSVYLFVRFSFDQNCSRAERQLEALLEASSA